ncbi:MAG TPA: alkaline phosphatase family protein [Patescibacteria group bacterium]|nr:alkaline phosphatase family protein [Patescibacteria group bacterium]
MNHLAPPRILVLIDALGWTYVREQGFLQGLLRYRAPIRTVLGFSSAAIPTILTGAPPQRHGHWNLLYYDPEHSPFRWLRRLDFLPERVLNNRLTRRSITEIGRRALGLGPLFDCSVNPRLLPWFNWVEKRNIFARGGITGAPSFFDEIARRDVSCRVYTYRDSSDEEIIQKAEKDLASGEADVLFLYLSEIDRFLHERCASRQDWMATLARYETRLLSLFEKALERDRRATCAVFSDHGMTPVRRHIDLAGEIGRLGYRMPEDFLAVYDSTMARYWFFGDRARQAITRHLAALPVGRILTDQELQRLGVFFGDRRYGELIYLLDAGCLLSDSGFHNGGWKPAGMHGYHPDDPYSDGVFLTNREPSSPVRSVADVHAFLMDTTFGAIESVANG